MIAAATTLLLASCARFGGGNPSPTPGPSGPLAHSDGEQLVFRIADVGGFLAPQYRMTATPRLTILGNGQVIVPGVVAAVFPGPLVQPLLVRQLSEQGLQAVLTEIVDSGQFARDAEWRGASAFVADASDTVMTLDADGRRVTVTVYGLGTVPTDGSDQRLSAEEQAAHRALQQLSSRLETMDRWLPAGSWQGEQWQPYRADALRLFVRDTTDESPDPSAGEANVKDWPGSAAPATFAQATGIDGVGCGVASGADAAAWNQATADVHQLVRWRFGERLYEVLVRPLLPDEAENCPPAP
jgi:hypothetical protein